MLWDTNALAVVTTWQLPSQAAAIAMSRAATAHMQAAVACHDEHLRLLDLGSGGVTQLFSGARRASAPLRRRRRRRLSRFAGRRPSSPITCSRCRG